MKAASLVTLWRPLPPMPAGYKRVMVCFTESYVEKEYKANAAVTIY